MNTPYLATYLKPQDIIWSDTSGDGFCLHRNSAVDLELHRASGVTDAGFTVGSLANLKILAGVSSDHAVTKFQLDNTIGGNVFAGSTNNVIVPPQVNLVVSGTGIALVPHLGADSVTTSSVTRGAGDLTISTSISGNVYVNSAGNVSFTSVGNTIVNGNLLVTGALITSSDERLKENIFDVDDAADLMRKIKPHYYTLRKDKQKVKRCGFIAQQVREVVPEAVYEDAHGMLSVDYPHFIGLLVQENQRLSHAVCQLQADMNKLNMQLRRLECARPRP